MKPISLSIFFPAYNEEANLFEAVTDAVAVARQSPYIRQFEIIIVDDGSTDRTAEIVNRLRSLHCMVRTVRHEKNRGYGAALKSGIRAATMEYLFFTDADLQFDIAELHHLLIHVAHYDAVIGYRAPRKDPLMRLLNAFGWNMLNRLLFGLRIRDIDCAFKLFRRSLIQGLTLRSRGAMLSAEILIRLSRQGVAIKEVPVSHLPRVAGSPTGAKPSVILRALREMMGLYWGELGYAGNKEVLRFLGVGVVNTLVDLVAYLLLTRTIGLFADHLVVAKFFSFMLGTATSLYLNRSWTFGLTSKLSMGEVMRFYTTISASVLLNVFVMQVLLGIGTSDIFAFFVATLSSATGNFLLSKFWVFKPTIPLAAQS